MSSCSSRSDSPGSTSGAGNQAGSTSQGCTQCTITSQAVATTPSNRARTKIGVGEEVTLTVSPGPANWAVSGGGSLSSTSGTSVTFTAGDRAANANITATGAGCSCSIALTIVEPSGLFVRQIGTGVRHTQGRPTCGFRGQAFVTPADVSFARIELREQKVTADATGAYTQWKGADHDPNPQWGPVLATVDGAGTPDSLPDQIWSGDPGGAAPYAPGYLQWDIGWEFRVGSGSAKKFTTAIHRQEIEASGRVTISKGGLTISRNLNDPTESW